jgi:DNA-directed RNA polymerase specialized sigma24 family protein
LHRVVANLVASGGRHAAVVDRKLGDLPRPDHEPSPEVASIDAEEALAVRRALASLGVIDRRALVMAAQGYRGPEIAHRLGRTQGATRTLLCRARSRLRGELVAAGVSR